MRFRSYDSERDKQALHRLWRGIGWLQEGKEETMDLFIASGRALVAEVDGEAESLSASVPGTIRYLGQELPLSAVTSVSTSRRVRGQGLAKRLTAQLVAADATEGALVSALGMFEQGFYDQLGFGTGSYENWISFDPAQLKVESAARVPRRLTADDWELVHRARLERRRVHGSCNLLPPEITESELRRTPNGFGFGYDDRSASRLTHCFWCWTREPLHGPYQVSFLAYQTWEQLLELLAVFKSFGDQVWLVRLREPPGLQFQDLLEQPFRRRGVSERTSFETTVRAVAYWQMRVCDVAACLARTRLRGSDVRFNLQLSDPIERFLDQSAPWRGISGDYVVTLGQSSGAEVGTDQALPTLKASVGAFTRMWLGVAPASSLAATDDLSAPQELLEELDWVLRLPQPRWDWDF